MAKNYQEATTDCAAADYDRCQHPTEWTDEVGDRQEHYFSGYGWFAAYHKECCPREMDGTACDLNHD